MKEKNKALHIAILVIGIIAYLVLFMFMGPWKNKLPDAYMGVLSEIQVIIATILVTTNRKRGFITACALAVLSLVSAGMAVLRGVPTAITGVLIAIIIIATMGIIYGYLSTSENQREEITKQYEQIMDSNRIIQEQNDSLKAITYTDQLTGLPNRRYFQEQMEDAIKLQMPFTIIYIDMDNFKVINDQLGPKTGDAALIAYSERVSGYCGRKHKFARVAGDEFAILLAGEQTEADVLNIIEQLRRMFMEPVSALDAQVAVTASYGIAACPRDGKDSETLLDCAIMATYNAKANGKDRPCFFSPASGI